MRIFSVCLLLLFLCSARSGAISVESNHIVNDYLIVTELEETVSLKCRTDEGTGEQELQWLRNGLKVQLTEENKMSESSLCIHPVSREDDGVIFTCQLRKDASMNVTIELEVKYAPDLSGTEEIEVEEQSDVTLSCNVKANPAVTVRWERDGEILDMSTGGYTASNNGVTAELSIKNVKQPIHPGNYMCVATYMAKELSKTFKLAVTEKTMKFPLGPTIAGVVVVFFTILLAILSRWQKIAKCCKK
ncbi:transmembrane and immunoglobulin domain-containing protein 1 [Chanos chanos]|uniref:transmembrane and immunoglobulin domain-containing protein 1 n=1 Tax=Chanos chanos TaxID=29144 RepID=UPI0011F1E5E0|nr:transmembrane and immunoglobulin domain-containing protein 1 [Chanos chanos]